MRWAIKSEYLKTLCTLLCLTLLLGSLSHAQADVEVSVDRDEVVRGETLTMSIRVNNRQGGVSLDISSLNSRFEVISTRSSSRLQTINNRVQAWTEYTLVLFPLQLGEQEIPPIVVDGQATQAFVVTVLEADDSTIASSNPNLRMETSISGNDVYVQEQLLYTVRLYFTISGIRNPNFTDLSLENAVVQTLGPPNQYEEIIDGQRYGVYEINYVIFPQRSGELVIPDMVFRGQVTDGSSRYVFRNTHVEPVTAFADGHQVRVRERPSAYPSNATWLPARHLQLNETWSADPQGLMPGDSVDREITVRGVGLDGPALPPLPSQDVEGLNVYPEGTDISRRIEDGDVVGRRVERYSLVATEPGTVQVPEVRIPWWNVDTESVEFAVLPARTITVSGPSVMEPGSGISQLPVDQQDPAAIEPAAAPIDELISSARTPTWILALLAALLATIAVLLLMIYRRSQQAVDAAGASLQTQPYQREIAVEQEAQAFRDLQQACARSDAGAIRLSMIAWARQYYQDADLHTLDALVRRSADEAVEKACRQLQHNLYGVAGGNPDVSEPLSREQAADLLNAVSALRRRELDERRANLRQVDYALPPLYRSS